MNDSSYPEGQSTDIDMVVTWMAYFGVYYGEANWIDSELQS
ncbi:hypothetical protein ES702_00251 [subsurface metagenome]